MTYISLRNLKRAAACAAPAGILLTASIVNAQATGATLENPLRYADIPQFVAGALRVLVMVALPIISLFVVYSGFLFVSARGNEGKLSEAKQNFVYVIIGAVLILGAWVLASLIGGTVSELTK